MTSAAKKPAEVPTEKAPSPSPSPSPLPSPIRSPPPPPEAAPSPPPEAAAAPSKLQQDSKDKLGSHDERWERNFEQLVAFKAQHGHLKVPPTDVKLSNFVFAQRKQAKRGKMYKEDRRKRLDDLGFVWSERKGDGAKESAKSKNDEKWERHFEQLVAFKAQHGHLRVPQTNVKLFNFVFAQRRQARKAMKYKEERRRRLDDLGFVWSAKEERGSSSPGHRTDKRENVATSTTEGVPETTVSESIASLFRRVAVDMGRDPSEVLPHVSKLETQWIFTSSQLRRMDVDTLARFIPYGLAMETIEFLNKDKGAVMV